MMGIWDIDDFCNAEAESLEELLSCFIDRDGDLSGYV